MALNEKLKMQKYCSIESIISKRDHLKLFHKMTIWWVHALSSISFKKAIFQSHNRWKSNDFEITKTLSKWKKKKETAGQGSFYSTIWRSHWKLIKEI